MDKEGLLYGYFSNSLTDQQRKQFDKLLEEDLEFKSQFEFENSIKQAAFKTQKETLKIKLQSFENEMHKKGVFTKKPSFNWRIAASIAILITAGWFGYQSFLGVDYDELYSDNYSVYPNTVYTITRNDTDDTPERQAFVAYETGNYQLAINKLNSLKDKPYSNFYKAQSYLKLNNNNEAKKQFEQVLKDDDKFIAEAQWYLALIAVKEQDKTTAKTYLNNVVMNGSYKKEEAQVLLKQLD